MGNECGIEIGDTPIDFGETPAEADGHGGGEGSISDGSMHTTRASLDGMGSNNSGMETASEGGDEGEGAECEASSAVGGISRESN